MQFLQRALQSKYSALILSLLTFSYFLGIELIYGAVAQSQDQLRIELKEGTASYMKDEEDETKKCSHPISSSVSFNPGDEPIAICLDPGATINIYCPPKNGQRYAPIPLSESSSSPSASPSRPMPNCASARPLGPNDTLPGGSRRDIPYIISPRFTRLNTQKPVFRWNSTGDLNASYTVQLYRIVGNNRDKKPIWEVKEVLASQVLYPDKAPLLSSEYDYQLVVIAKSGTSSEDELNQSELKEYQSSNRGNVRGIRFRPFSSGETSTVNSEVRIIVGKDTFPYPGYIKDLSSDKAIDVALFYAQRNNLYAEAIEVLTNFIQQQQSSRNPVEDKIYLVLGDLYKDVGLNCLAIQSYDYIQDTQSKEFERSRKSSEAISVKLKNRLNCK
jgi:hypothetical protein